MTDTAEIACRLLQVEQQLAAYQKLHKDELVELWRILDDCKDAIVRLSEGSGQAMDPGAAENLARS